MHLAEVLAPLLPRSGTGGVIALVGAGGKTSALFGLAEELAWTGRDVVMTTTTHLRDPRLEQGRSFDRVVFDSPGDRPWDSEPPWPDRGRRIVFASGAEPATGKLRGVDPVRIGELDRAGAFILVEADGAKFRPIKAPAAHEPVVPAMTDLVVGIMGLDCLGRPMDDTTVHRPERFGSVTGCAPGAPIRLEHLQALARSPQGLFKGAPAMARRALLLNKADRCSVEPADLLIGFRDSAPPCVDLILVCTLRAPHPADRVLAQGATGSWAPAPDPGGTSPCR